MMSVSPSHAVDEAGVVALTFRNILQLPRQPIGEATDRMNYTENVEFDSTARRRLAGRIVGCRFAAPLSFDLPPLQSVVWVPQLLLTGQK